jgi:predicted RNA-binding protein YlxR (DUF448 family)
MRVTAGLVDGRLAVLPDPTATAPGRGAHLHPTVECYELAVRRKAFGRALRCDGGLSAAAVGEYLDSLTVIDPPRNRSNSS